MESVTEDDSIFQKEYEKIVDAHFNSSERVTTFFSHLLLVYGVPIFILQYANNIDADVKAYILITIAGIGFFVCTYLIRLRMESILYARTINGARRYYHDKNEKLNYNTLCRYNVLPMQIQKPAYFDTYQFIYIVITLAFINSGYFAAGLYFKWGYTWPVFCAPIFGLIHFWNYWWSSRQEEAGVCFYKHRIGVDIDGVLNLHEEQFCEIIKEQKIDIKPEQITKMPVREANIGVTEENEIAVFKNKKYWVEMPERQDAKKEIGRIKNQLGYKVLIFTWRDWGKGEWDIKEITREWLNNKGFIYDKLYFEEGNLHNPINIKFALYKNRYYLSKKYKIKYFIEDDLEKAMILSNICKAVFLINHKYNMDENLPINIIRVNDWYEIFKHIKSLG